MNKMPITKIKLINIMKIMRIKPSISISEISSPINIMRNINAIRICISLESLNMSMT